MSVDLGTDVETIGERLGEAIAELDAYERYETAQEAVKASDQAQELIERFEQRRHAYLVARQSGQVTEADAQEVRELQDELHALPVMQEFLEAQRELEGRLVAVNDAVSRGLAVDFADVAGSCCHD
ncbi:MAG: YlbF family regulator [Halobacteriales archaeon]